MPCMDIDMDKGHNPVFRPKLLVVDDEPDICEFIGFVAREIGFDTTLVDDAHQFPLAYSKDQNVIVLDLSMPGFDGIELIRFLADNRSEAAIILISGFDSGVLNSAKELAVSQGLSVAGTLSKPVSIDKLERLLLEIPAQKKSQRYNSKGTEELPSTEELKDAITNKDVFVHFQPKINISSRTLAGSEALARWRHPVKGMIPPSMFVPLSEDFGLINDLTALIIEDTLEHLGRWKTGGVNIKASINMSAKTLVDLDFPDNLLACVRKHDLDPSQVVIEITESSVMGELKKSLDILTRLRMKGFHLSIDDFGTGYSSMQQLKRVPFSELKVDQSFVSHAIDDQKNLSIVETTINLGHRLGMIVVAEGVEDEKTWDLLAELGCDQAQGYLMGRPMPGGDFMSWLKEWEKSNAILPME